MPGDVARIMFPALPQTGCPIHGGIELETCTLCRNLTVYLEG